MNAADPERLEDRATAAGRSRRGEGAAHILYLAPQAPGRWRSRTAREDFAEFHPVRAIVTTVLASASFDWTQGGRPCRRSRVVLGVPWVLVLLHAVALIVSAMAGLALALFA